MKGHDNEYEKRLPGCLGCLAYLMLVGSLFCFWVMVSVMWSRSGSQAFFLMPVRADNAAVANVSDTELFVYTVQSAATFFVSIGLLRRRLWAWRLFLFVMVVDAIATAGILLATRNSHGLVGLILSVLLIIYLLSGNVRDCFE